MRMRRKMPFPAARRKFPFCFPVRSWRRWLPMKIWERVYGSCAGSIADVRWDQQKFGFGSAFGKDGSSSVITKIGISFNSDGTTSFFAELEKVSASQRKRIEQRQEERLTQKKEDAKKAEREKQGERLEGKADQKSTIVQADSMEELLEKFRKWTGIQFRL